MGGSVCKILVKSTLRYTVVPTAPLQVEKFDAQMRQIHFNPEYAQSIVNETDDAEAICVILGKANADWTTADRQKLLDVVNEICGPYP